jgi:hypothetical protein
MTPKSNPRYWLEKMSHRKTGYPVATIAYYGPDDKFASKVVAGIIATEHAEPLLKKWFTTDIAARLDPVIIQEILEFIQEHHVARVAMLDRIIGCPHEEGIDYPKGEPCLQCPFWANRDRWTGELLS